MNRLVRLFLVIVMLVLSAARFGSTSVAAQASRSVVGLVLNEDGNTITVVDPQTLRVMAVHRFDGVLDRPHLAAFDPASHRLYVGNKGSTLAVFDLSDVMAPRLVANLKPGGNGEIHWIALANGLVWLAHEGDSAVYAYEQAALTEPAFTAGRAEGFNTTHGAALRPGTDELWVTNRPRNAPGFVLRIDTRTRAVIGQPLLTTGNAGDRPNNVGFTSDGRWAYVVNEGPEARQVTVVDAATFQVVQQIEQEATRGLSPHALTFDPVTRRMFVVNKMGGYLTVINVDTNTLLDYVAVGAEPHAVARGPDGNIYVAAKRDNKLTVVNPYTLAVVKELVDPALVGPHFILFATGTAPAAPAPAPAPAPLPAPQPALMPLPETSVEGTPLAFPQTGYSLDGEFLSYWRANGGLPVFGYPIASAQQVDGRVAQWLERARFELHQENSRARVMLGRLGVEALERQGRDWRSFPKASPGAPHYFAQTGHAIAYAPFWRYWSSHGLEFDGRRGTSMAESLALFGYPISEVQMETNQNGDRVLTQWFERARFEYHPRNPAASRVLLGRLGSELRVEYGW